MTEQAEPSAYDLLSKPTLELTDAEVERIVIDLRKRRFAYVNKAVADRPDKPKKEPLTPEQKAANTARAAASLNLDLGF